MESNNLGKMLEEKLKEKNEKKIYIKDLKPEMEIEIEGKVISKKLQPTKDGSHFFLFTIRDKTGNIRVVDWHNPIKNNERLKEGDVIRVKGKVVFFDNRNQINLAKDENAIYVLSEEEIDPERFLMVSKKDPNEMWNRLIEEIKRIKNRYLRKLLYRIFLDDNEISSRFIEAPAAITVHHAYKHGLLEHTLNVLEICKNVRSIYSDILNMDILISGAILHDIGKIYTYKITPSGINVTDEGELLGHIFLGIKIVEDKIKKILDFPKEIEFHLNHMILSHHGELEWGSPIVPKTPEAFILHFADNIDSKVEQVRTLMENTKGSNWSEYDKYLGRKIWVFNGGIIGGWNKENKEKQ